MKKIILIAIILMAALLMCAQYNPGKFDNLWIWEADITSAEDSLTFNGTTIYPFPDSTTSSLTVLGTANEVTVSTANDTTTVSLPDSIYIEVIQVDTLYADSINVRTITGSGDLNITGNISGIFPDSLSAKSSVIGVTNETNVVSLNDVYTVGLTDDVNIADTLTVGGSVVANGTVTGSNLSGSNTGDQDLSGYVPYTGADSTLNMGDEDIIVDTLKSMSLYDVSPEGLVLGMNFNTETITGSTVYDASFCNNHGTIYNATPDADAGFNDGGAITFTGTDTSYVEIPDDSSLDITEAITLMAWAKDPPAWLGNWAYRRKITIPADSISATITDFPLLIHISSSCGISSQDLTGIFTEVTTNSKKIALTAIDGTTQCYVEIEYWDNASQEAWLWARIPSISSIVSTSFYLYYDSSQADNDTYIGDTNSAPADSVWTNDFTAVYHLAESGITIYDSSPNDYDGSKNTATDPVRAEGLIGYGQYYTDSAGDWIDCNNVLLPATADFSITALANPDGFSTYLNAIVNQGIVGNYFYLFYEDSAPNVIGALYNGANRGVTVISTNEWHMNQLTTASVKYNVYLDTSHEIVNKTAWSINQANNTMLGSRTDKSSFGVFNGTLDEIRISSVARSDGWREADSNSQYDELNTFGSQEIVSISKSIIQKQNAYEIGCALADSSFFGYINAQKISVTGEDLLSYRLFTMTYDKANIKLYLDGVQVATQAYTTAITANDSTLTIGKSFSGEIDDVSIYNRALSADEIWAYYANRVEVADPYFSKNDASVEMIGTLEVIGTLDAPTLNTGQGDNELYAMNQDVETTDDVTFNSVTATTYVKGEHLESTDDAKVADSLDVGTYVNTDTLRANKIKLNSVALLGTPQAGTMEFADNKLYFTNVCTQRALDRTSDVLDSTFTVTDTLDEITIYTGTIGANCLKAGNILKLHADGIVSTNSASDDVTVKIYLGATEVLSFNPAIGNVTGAQWYIDGNMTVRSIGTVGTMAYHLDMTLSGNETVVIGTGVVNTTIADDFTVTVTWDNANAGNIFSIYQGYTEWKN